MALIKKYLTPRNPFAFKRLFGTVKNKDILLAVLNTVLKEQLHKPIKEVTFIHPVSAPPAVAARRLSIVEALCQDEDGCQYIIQLLIETADLFYFHERAAYYAYNAYIAPFKRGEKYPNLTKVIFLVFCDLPIASKGSHYKMPHITIGDKPITIDDKTYKYDLNMFSFTFIDLVKFAKERTKKVHNLTFEEKIYYLFCRDTVISDEALALLTSGTEAIEKAFGEVDRLKWSKEALEEYNALEKQPHN